MPPDALESGWESKLNELLSVVRQLDTTRLYERLGHIEVSLAALSTNMEETRRVQDDHDVAIYGPPENGGNPGLKGRVAALEGDNRLYKLAFAAVWGVLATIAIAYAVERFTHNERAVNAATQDRMEFRIPTSSQGGR